MDAYDASKMILTRIQALDPENASKIMGYILIQDLGDKELIRLAHGPETHLVSLINKAKSFLGFSTNMSPRVVVPNVENNGFHGHHHHGHLNSPGLSSSSPSSPWSNGSNGFPAFSRKTPISASYASVVNAGSTQSNATMTSAMGSSSSLSSVNLGSEEFHGNFHVPDQLSPIMSPSGFSDSVIWSYDDHSTPHANPFHRRSCSVNDAYLFEDGGEGGGQNSNFLGGWRPCMYYARGFCKNGSSCKFSHTFDAASAADLSLVGSPNNIDGFEYLRLKAIQQQRFAAASELMASSPRHSFPYKRSNVAALMGEEFQKFGPCGPDMNNFSGMGLDCNSSARQIYLTFPADSAFTEEDVSNYFSMYGPVQDVRIPYQQKRMFGFVTFVYAETVYLILAKGNPHFVCDSRVLVKPYKEKGKVVEKKRQQQLLDRGESPACPTGFDGREPYDFPFGGRTFFNAKEMMLKNKLVEQAELQQAIELQGRRLLNMRMMDLKNNFNHQSRPSFPLAFPLTSRLQTNPQMFQNMSQPSDGIDVEVEEVNPNVLDIGDSSPNVGNEKDTKEASVTSDENNGCDVGSKESKDILEVADLGERFEHILPDNLFASPTKTVTDLRYLPERVPTETVGNTTTITSSNYNTVLMPGSMTLGAAEPAQSCHFQMPRFPSGQGVVEM